ncbi:hypothetical protein BH10PSE15_BH10PSE15_04170 [soil metagenome]
MVLRCVQGTAFILEIRVSCVLLARARREGAQHPVHLAPIAL